MKRSHRTVSFVLAVTAATLGFSGIAGAKGAGDSQFHRVEVSYGDLDLARAPDAQKLYARISSAAREACEQPRVLFRSAVFNECYTKAVDGAVQDVNNPNLTAVHLRSADRRSVAAAGR